MARRPRLQFAESAGGAEVIDLYDYMPGPKVSRRTAKRSQSRKPLPIVTDDWPEIIPITKAELDLIEVYLRTSSTSCSAGHPDLQGECR